MLVERLCGAIWRAAGHTIPAKFPRMTYQDAMASVRGRIAYAVYVGMKSVNVACDCCSMEWISPTCGLT